ncbi:hypothetical protein L0222_05870 [bacterium]|nr:hypothetical protein [bacterium]
MKIQVALGVLMLVLCNGVYAGTTPKVGGPGGDHVASIQCPAPEFAIGEVLYRIDVRYGLWIDSFQGHCRKP